MRLLLLLLILPAFSCVTAGELARLQSGLEAVRVTVNDREATLADIGGAVDTLGDDLEDVIENVEERTKGMLSIGDAGLGGTGLLSLGLLALNQFRNGKRRKRNEPV